MVVYVPTSSAETALMRDWIRLQLAAWRDQNINAFLMNEPLNTDGTWDIGLAPVEPPNGPVLHGTITVIDDKDAGDIYAYFVVPPQQYVPSELRECLPFAPKGLPFERPWRFDPNDPPPPVVWPPTPESEQAYRDWQARG